MKTLSFTSMLLIFTTFSLFAAQNNSFIGTWCTEDGLILTFSGKDSLFASSKSDESIKGCGTFQKTDSTFTARIINSDMTMEMKYRYKWLGSDSVSAKALAFTINGEATETPAEWMSMTRCDAKSSGNQNVSTNSKSDETSKNKKTNKK